MLWLIEDVTEADTAVPVTEGVIDGVIEVEGVIEGVSLVVTSEVTDKLGVLLIDGVTEILFVTEGVTLGVAASLLHPWSGAP